MKTVPTIALLLVAAASRAAAGDDDGAKSPAAAKDRALVARVAGLLPPGDRSAQDWLKALEVHSSVKRDVGGGASVVFAGLDGESTSLEVQALLREDRVVEVAMRCYDSDLLLKDAWGKLPVTQDALGWRYAWFDPSRKRAHGAALEKDLGARADPKVPQALAKEFETLDGALVPVLYGTSCGEDGGPPTGRAALEGLVKARATAALRALLRSPNPAGRVYAVEGLDRLAGSGEALTDADRAAIRWIKASAVPVMYCVGCSFADGPAAEAIESTKPPKDDDGMK